MSSRIKLLDIELSQPIETITDLDGYQALQGLVRLHGTPLGIIHVPVTNGCCLASVISQAVLDQYLKAIVQQGIYHHLGSPDTDWHDSRWQGADLLKQITPLQPSSLSVTVALCVQSIDAVLTLASLESLAAGDHEILIVQSAPTDDALAQLIASRYPRFRYLSTPGNFNAACNLAIAEAQGDIIAFTDSNSQVDVYWARAIAAAFDRNADAVALTGLVVTDQLETEAQSAFEQGYSLGRGYNRRWYHLSQAPNWTDFGTMQLGTGVNMAFRRSALAHLGGFDESLNAFGGELDLFCRVLLSGQTLIYEPSAIVRYRAPLTEESLQAQVRQTSAGFYGYLTASWRKYPQHRRQLLMLGGWKLARLLLMLTQPTRHLAQVELQSGWQGWRHPLKGDSPATQLGGLSSKLPAPKRLMAVRQVDLSQRLPTWTDLGEYQAVRVFVVAGGAPIGSVDIQHRGQIVSAGRLQHQIANDLTLALLAIPHQHNQQVAWAAVETAIRQAIAIEPEPSSVPPLTPDVPVSIVITTCDRPDDLRNCLTHLIAQQTQHPVEIIVADNRPASNLTPPVVMEFPQVQLVQETRPGGAYGRNAAIAASTGDIIVTVDDDITVPPDWLEKLIAPMARPEVAIVMGNVFPRELETPAQLLFERLFNGLSQGFKPLEVDSNWLASFPSSPPTWELGVSANAAFRANIFAHPHIGLMDEVLGPGTPTSGAEENYLTYKVLKAGYTLVYQPQAYVWHRHRREMSALHRQIYGYMKSATAYDLTLWLQEHDWRGFQHLIWQLPYYFMQRLYHRLRGWNDTPWPMLWREIAGYLAGFWSYWQSRQLVKRQGRSNRYIPVADRAIAPILPKPDSAISEPMRVEAHGN